MQIRRPNTTFPNTNTRANTADVTQSNQGNLAIKRRHVQRTLTTAPFDLDKQITITSAPCSSN